MTILKIIKKFVYFVIIFLSLYIIAYIIMYDNEPQKTIIEAIEID